MSRQPKDFEYLSCKLDREISEKFTDFCEEAASNKTVTIEIITKVLFDDKDCSIAAKFEYGTPEVETMTNDEFNEVFEERLNKLMKNERRCR